jgi:hypothetical protein
MQEIWIQAIGFLALMMYLVSYQFKSNRGLFTFQLLGAALFALQYSLIGGATGALSQVIKVLRSLILLKYNDWPWVRGKGPMLFFCGLYLLATVYTWAGPLSLIVLLASVVSTAVFWTNNARTIRVVCLVFICPCWLIYAFFTGSLGGILNETFTIVSILISIYRFGWKALGEPQHD